MGGSDVRGRHGHSLVADRLEKTLPSGLQRDAFVAHGARRMYLYRRHLPVRHRGYATLHLFPILKIDRYTEGIKTVHFVH